MIRKLRTAALLLTVPAALGVGLVTTGGAAAATPRACTTAGPIEINGFAFAPPTVTPGESSTADLISTNCTALSVATEEQWSGQWIGATGTGIPAGCPVIDPYIRPVTYAPFQELAVNTGYLVPPSCTAIELAVTVRISTTTGAVLESATAYLHILQP